ncbi:hypothetical protein PVA44_06535 [Entomospira nematocerorum]|uniref:Uncharacterized protein n=1 Tax=Entomospira nematocerorum TaxID=2719987 RepID=A0A968KUL2_9SPIO|nr:hypothetical protein [Entomospira nematocera]NIZ46323.1 hypothetical protein [Entomospira nematocera]WDI33873.1 hypothetical protein PVA44_06535 [Entomospira nematocera]
MKRILLIITITIMMIPSIYSIEPERKQFIQLITPKTEYAIYMLWGSLPVLYASMHMQMHDVPSIVWAQRREHFDFSHLPQHVQQVEDLYLREGHLARVIQELARDSSARFTVYLTDTMAGWAILQYFISIGISLDRLDIELLSDGSATTNLYYQQYINDPSAAISRYQLQRQKVRRALYHTTYVNGERLATWDYHYMYAFSTELPRVRYWLPHTTAVFPINSLIHLDMNWFVLPFHTLYDALTNDQKRQFERLLQFNREEFDAVLYTTEESQIPVIMIGAWSTDSNGNRRISATFEQDVKELISRMGKGYRFFFKGHPELPSGNPKEQALMKQLGFETLPNVSFPFELLLLAYPQLIVGGYSSSVFVTANKDQLRFILGSLTTQPVLALHERGMWPLAMHIVH